MRNIRKKIAAVLYIILSIFALLIWMCFIIIASFGPAPPPPGIEYEGAISASGFVLLGLVGAALGIVGGIKGLTKKLAGKCLFITITVLITIGSIPFFLRDEIAAAAGVILLLAGILPTLIYILVSGKREVEVKDLSSKGQ